MLVVAVAVRQLEDQVVLVEVVLAAQTIQLARLAQLTQAVVAALLEFPHLARLLLLVLAVQELSLFATPMPTP